jgi:hypothetical protein
MITQQVHLSRALCCDILFLLKYMLLENIYVKGDIQMWIFLLDIGLYII